MSIWLLLALTAAFFETLAVQKQDRKLELFAKPAVMIFVLVWLYGSTNFQGRALWFGLGILFSLLGDMILLSPTNRMFVLGLTAFLLAHVFYIAGFMDQLLNFSAWSLILISILYINGMRLLRRIVGAMRASGQDALVTPVIVYGLIVTLMLYGALSTIFDPAWKTGAAFLVSAGAFLFWLSDLILGWIKFVSPLKNGRVLNIVTYYLGQIGLIAGIINQLASS